MFTAKDKANRMILPSSLARSLHYGLEDNTASSIQLRTTALLVCGRTRAELRRASKECCRSEEQERKNKPEVSVELDMDARVTHARIGAELRRRAKEKRGV